MIAFSDGCCPGIDWFEDDEKQQGTFILQSENVNGNCYYVLEGGEWQDGIWMCGDSWWVGELSDKGQCKGIFQASTDSKPNVPVQDDSLQWKWVDDGNDYYDYAYDDNDAPIKFECVDLCL